MFSNQDAVVIAFKLINFIAALGVGFFLFKKHVLPGLLLSIARKKNKQDSLFLQQDNLEKQQRNLDILLQEDAAQCESFRTNINAWKSVVTQEHTQLKKEHDTMLVILRKRREHAAMQREQKHIQNIVAHTVIQQLQTSLSDHFAKAEKSSEYLDAIIDFMNKRVS
jgi:hypothetical protein